MSARFPTQQFPWQRVWLAGLIALAFLMGVIASSLVAGRHGQASLGGDVTVGASAQPTTDEYAAYLATQATMATAVARHDWATAAQYRTLLDRQLTPSVIEGLYADRAQLLRNLAAADARGDRHRYETFRARLAALCPAITNRSIPSFCH
jgi:hypothetical protein